MAHVQTTAPIASVAPQVQGFFTKLKANYTEWRRFHTTLNELQQLSSRELADLGMSRAMLRSVAWDAAKAK